MAGRGEDVGRASAPAARPDRATRTEPRGSKAHVGRGKGGSQPVAAAHGTSHAHGLQEWRARGDPHRRGGRYERGLRGCGDGTDGEGKWEGKWHGGWEGGREVGMEGGREGGSQGRREKGSEGGEEAPGAGGPGQSTAQRLAAARTCRGTGLRRPHTVVTVRVARPAVSARPSRGRLASPLVFGVRSVFRTARAGPSPPAAQPEGGGGCG